MKITAMIALLLFISLFSRTSTADAIQCGECHSKKPSMVRMHNALKGRGCFGCHKIGEKLMGKARNNDLEALRNKRVSDPSCVECHK